MPIAVSLNHTRSSQLNADCSKCFGLCCVALPFARSADFAFDKDGGVPCPNLQADFRCGIHTELRETGFRGCTVYECFGAGQKVSQLTYNGMDWRNNPMSAGEMYAVLPVMQQLHEMLYYVNEALNAKAASILHSRLQEALVETERLTFLDETELLALDVAHHRTAVNSLLLQASEWVRSKKPEAKKSKKAKKIKPRSNLMGAALKEADLRCTNLRGSLLIAADLQNADLRNTDFIGADLRDANLSGADLTGAIFLTQAQVNSANGNALTKLPASLIVPNHWL
ncbi:pentapeptide repeat-containing protein [Planococcus sp. YIM B11945]|uniref:pentapeptide repeat-containing protein n=1 Tax=Planococcus sp. YIM B11945 TaxID=3435410 RepID=UPI003D7DDDC5